MEFLKRHKDETAPHNPGLTLDEIRYQRAYTAAKVEMARQHIVVALNEVKGSGGAAGLGGRLLGSVLSNMNLIDYGLIAFRLGSQVMKIVRKFKRRRG